MGCWPPTWGSHLDSEALKVWFMVSVWVESLYHRQQRWRQAGNCGGGVRTCSIFGCKSSQGQCMTGKNLKPKATSNIYCWRLQVQNVYGSSPQALLKNQARHCPNNEINKNTRDEPVEQFEQCLLRAHVRNGSHDLTGTWKSRNAVVWFEFGLCFLVQTHRLMWTRLIFVSCCTAYFFGGCKKCSD